MDDAEPLVAPSEALGSNAIVGRFGVGDFNPSAPPHSTPEFALDLLDTDQIMPEIAGVFRPPLVNDEGVRFPLRKGLTRLGLVWSCSPGARNKDFSLGLDTIF